MFKLMKLIYVKQFIVVGKYVWIVLNNHAGISYAFQHDYNEKILNVLSNKRNITNKKKLGRRNLLFYRVTYGMKKV